MWTTFVMRKKVEYLQPIKCLSVNVLMHLFCYRCTTILKQQDMIQVGVDHACFVMQCASIRIIQYPPFGNNNNNIAFFSRKTAIFANPFHVGHWHTEIFQQDYVSFSQPGDRTLTVETIASDTHPGVVYNSGNYCE